MDLKDHDDPARLELDDQKQENTQFKLGISNLSNDLIQAMMDKCRINPTGSLIGKQDDQLVNWKYWFDDDGRCHVVVPSDLESHADSWPHIVGILAANRLNAMLHVGKPSEELGFTVAQDSYLHGIGSCLKQGSIEYQKVSGAYMQGYGWTLSHTEVVQKFPEWFRTRWTSPLVFLTGKKVWNQAPGGDKGRWYNLVLRAARACTLQDAVQWIISYPERKRIFVKETWSFTKGAVFTENERKAMELSCQNELETYKNLCDELKKPSMDTIETFKSRLETVSKSLRQYDEHIGAIATQRAKYLYSPKMKKLLGKGAWLLQDRFDALNTIEFIECSNATGLLFHQRTRVPIKIRDRNIDYHELHSLVKNQHYKLDPEDRLGESWFEWIENMLLRYIRSEEEEEDAKGVSIL